MKLSDENAAVIRLVAAFGADVLVSRPERQVLSRRVRGWMRVAAGEAVSACHSCGLHDGCRGPIAPLWPADDILARAQILCVLESPTADDDKARAVATGRIGRLIRSGLQQAAIDPGDCAFTYVNSCRAHDEGIQRPPSPAEQAACHENLLHTVRAADAEYVVLFGATAVRAWRDDVKLTDVAAKLFMWGDKFVWPMWSIQAVLRDAYEMQTWHRQLSRLSQIIADNDGIDALYANCVDCGTPVYGYDQDGVPWCRTHLPDHARRRSNQGQRQSKFQTNQLTLGVQV